MNFHMLMCFFSVLDQSFSILCYAYMILSQSKLNLYYIILYFKRGGGTKITIIFTHTELKNKERLYKFNKIYNKNNLFTIISVISFVAWTAFQHQYLSETFQQEPFLHRAKIGPILVVNDVYNVKHNK